MGTKLVNIDTHHTFKATKPIVCSFCEEEKEFLIYKRNGTCICKDCIKESIKRIKES